MEYSVDMIRLRFSISHKYIKRAIRNIKWNAEVNMNNDYKEYESTKPFGYRYNITYQINDTSLYLGLENNKDDKNMKTGVMEYNPNKIKISEHKEYMDIIKWSILNDNLEILSFDIAIDIQTDIKLLKFINPKRSETIMKSSKGKTHYFGKSRYSGYTRVYDKASEQGKDEILTRYEVRFKDVIDYNDVMKLLDLIQGTKLVEVFKVTDKEITDKTLKAVVYAVQHGYDYKDLTRAYKNKVKEYIGDEQVVIDKMIIYYTILEYIQILQDNIDMDKNKFRINA